MSHSHRAQRRRRGSSVQTVLGVVALVVGLILAILALVALTKPEGRKASSTTVTSTAEQTPTVSAETGQPSPGSSGAPTTGATTTGAPTTGTSSPGTAATSSSAPGAGAVKVPLLVLNNTQVPGLAAIARTRFENGGWTVTRTDNYSNTIISTVAYYDPADPANQQAALALQQQFPAIKRVVPRFAELPTGPVVVVLTTDYS